MSLPFPKWEKFHFYFIEKRKPATFLNKGKSSFSFIEWQVLCFSLWIRKTVSSLYKTIVLFQAKKFVQSKGKGQFFLKFCHTLGRKIQILGPEYQLFKISKLIGHSSFPLGEEKIIHAITETLALTDSRPSRLYTTLFSNYKRK